MIHVCYGMYDRDGRYSKFCGTSIVSMFENTCHDVTVHLFHDNTLTLDNRDKFNLIAGKYNQQIKFYNVEELAAERFDYIRRSLSRRFANADSIIGMFYRLLMSELISQSIDKIIYLDAGDTLVNLDIKNIWNVELDDHPLAACLDNDRIKDVPMQRNIVDDGFVKYGNYFNSGVMIINPEKWRAESNKIFGDVFTFWLKNAHRYYFPDQDILNYCFANEAIHLPYDFNAFTNFERKSADRMTIKRKLYHFAGDTIELDCTDPFNRLYLEYFAKTPWFGSDIFGRFFNSISRFQKTAQMSLVNVTKLLAKRRRAFLVEKRNIPPVRELFEINDDELVIDASSVDVFERLIAALRFPDRQIQGGGRKNVFFILSGNYLGFRDFLVSRNFVEGIDFVNALPLVSGLVGIPTESYSIVRAM